MRRTRCINRFSFRWQFHRDGAGLQVRESMVQGSFMHWCRAAYRIHYVPDVICLCIDAWLDGPASTTNFATQRQSRR